MTVMSRHSEKLESTSVEVVIVKVCFDVSLFVSTFGHLRV